MDNAEKPVAAPLPLFRLHEVGKIRATIAHLAACTGCASCESLEGAYSWKDALNTIDQRAEAQPLVRGRIHLLVTRRDGSTELLDIHLPIAFSPAGISQELGISGHRFSMYHFTDAAGTDYYFNLDDGTYDGWGRAVMSNDEAEKLLGHARTGPTPPKTEVH